MLGQTNGRTDRRTVQACQIALFSMMHSLTYYKLFSNAIRQIFVQHLTVVPGRQLSLLLPGFVEGD